MKKLMVILAFCFGGLLCETASAQVSFRVNIGLPPIWLPVDHADVQYYYLPDVEAYYYVPRHRYIYLEDDQWVSRPYLPVRYRDYDLRNCRRYVINEPRPYLRDREYRERYSRENYRENRYYDNNGRSERGERGEYHKDNGKHLGQWKHRGDD